MYGTLGDSLMSFHLNSKHRSNHTSDVASILATYFPDVDLSADESKSKLKVTSDLVSLFSTQAGQHLLSQVMSLSIFMFMLYKSFPVV